MKRAINYIQGVSCLSSVSYSSIVRHSVYEARANSQEIIKHLDDAGESMVICGSETRVAQVSTDIRHAQTTRDEKPPLSLARARRAHTRVRNEEVRTSSLWSLNVISSVYGCLPLSVRPSPRVTRSAHLFLSLPPSDNSSLMPSPLVPIAPRVRDSRRARLTIRNYADDSLHRITRRSARWPR